MSLDRGLCEDVLARVGRLERELVEALSTAVQIESVNPKYPGQVYDQVVGGEGEVSKFVGEIYRARRRGRTLRRGARVRDRRRGDQGRGRWALADLQRPRRRGASGRSGKLEERLSLLGKIDGERVWGRGSTDMKSGVLAQAFAARALQECGVKLQGDLILGSVVGEEVMDHECGVTATVKRGYTADAAVVSEPSSPPRQASRSG